MKGIYGLKQASRGWHEELTRVFMHDLGITQSSTDHLVFYRMHGDEHIVVAMATDDIVITSKHLADVTKFKSNLSAHWDLNDLGEINWYLGFEFKRNRPCTYHID